MLKVYDSTKCALGYITKYKDLEIESVLSSGDKSLSFVYLAKKAAKDIQNEYYVESKTDRYVVKETGISTDGFPEFKCQLDLEELEMDVLETFSALECTLEEAANLALVGTGWTVDTNISKVRSVATMKATPLDILKKIRDAWMCEIQFDNKNKVVRFKDQFGENKGVFFTTGLNLRKMDLTIDTYDYYTRLIPIGKDNLRIDKVNGGCTYVENYQYTNKRKTMIWEDSNYTDAAALKEDAEKKLDDLSKPKKSYGADVINLSAAKPEYAIMSFGLGDTILLLDQKTGIKDKQRIVKMREYPQDPAKNKCELSNTTLTFEEYQERLEAAANAVENITNADGTVNGVVVKGVEADGIVGIETVIAGSETIEKVFGEIASASEAADEANKELQDVKLILGTLETTYLKVTEAEIKYTTIEEADIIKASVKKLDGEYANFKSTITDELAAKDAQIEKISGDLADYQIVVADELLVAKGWMAEGAIGDAQISKVSANKLNAGTIDTVLVNVKGSEGKLQIVDNTMQISDDNRVRVQVGKDAAGDYTLAVWDASGNLIWDALGATEYTIQRQIIRDSMVSDDAAIQALKIDFENFETALTQQGVTISGTMIQVGNKMLNVALSEQTQVLTEHRETLTDHAAKIAANESEISLKVSTQIYESDLAGIEQSLSTLDASLSIMNGKIAAKVEQADINKAINNLQIGARNLIRNAETLNYEEYRFDYSKAIEYLADENGNNLLDENGAYLIL